MAHVRIIARLNVFLELESLHRVLLLYELAQEGYGPCLSPTQYFLGDSVGRLAPFALI